MRIIIDSVKGAGLIGFAKNKLKQLRDRMTTSGLTVLRQRIRVGESTVSLMSSTWGDTIRITSEFYEPLVLLVKRMPTSYEAFEYLTLQVLGVNSGVDKSNVLDVYRAELEWYEAGYMSGLNVITEAPSSTGKVSNAYIFRMIGSHPVEAAAVSTSKRKIVLGDFTPVSGNIPVFGESLYYKGASFPFDMHADYTQYPVDRVVGKYIGGQRIYLSFRADYTTSYRNASAVLIRKAETPFGPYEYLTQIPTTRMQSFGGAISGPEDPFYDSDGGTEYDVADIYSAFTPMGLYASQSYTTNFMFALVYAGPDRLLSGRRFLDVYKISFNTGEVSIYGTVDLYAYTQSSWPSLNIIQDASGSDAVGYSIVPNSIDGHASPNADSVWVMYNVDGDIENFTGFFIDPLTFTGDVRPAGDFGIADSTVFYLGGSRFLAMYRSGTMNVRDCILSIWLNHDFDETKGEEFLNVKTEIIFNPDVKVVKQPICSHNRKFLYFAVGSSISSVDQDVKLAYFDIKSGKVNYLSESLPYLEIDGAATLV